MRKSSSALSWDWASLMFWCALSASLIWKPMVKTGSREVWGSWNTMLIRLPRILINSASGLAAKSSFWKKIWPSTMRPGGSMRPKTEKPVMLLPAPDSPTRPRIWPCSRSKLTSSTALTTPLRVKK